MATQNRTAGFAHLLAPPREDRLQRIMIALAGKRHQDSDEIGTPPMAQTSLSALAAAMAP
jgi:hypothetical protein